MADGTGILEFFVSVTFRLIAWIFFLQLDRLVPVIRHIDEDEMWYYRYPSVDSIIPKRYLYVFITVVPSIVFILQFIVNRREKSTIPDIITNLNGLTLAYCINGVITSVLKLSIGRPRPNFFLRCFPDGYGTNIDQCTGEYRGMMDGRKSFPSAHASFAFTSMVYLTLHLWRIIDWKTPRFLRGLYVFLFFMPLLVATLIAVSRTVDYHHHYSDVIGGALLGSTIAYIIHYLYAVIDTETQDKYLNMVERYSYISLNLS
ncbi:phospholipid phosphatase 5 [Leptinotarsa decemlineata]|uniref:phospholipid phosphatase 5 n=1 Tax=Leptinotarsa decemlineata TaxID=7539 RepID=UPI000C254DE0|nr:phospholipid phosphatase 5-like [Leptinotarsa decemlineata]